MIEAGFASRKGSEWPLANSEAIVDLLARTNSAHASFSEINDFVSSDSQLKAMLIRYANAPAPGLHRGIYSAMDAVRMLGSRNVRGLALTHILMQQRIRDCPQFDETLFWTEAIARAAACRFVVRQNECCSPDEAFICGLHSLNGLFILAASFPSRCRSLLYTECQSGSLASASSTSASFEVSHATLAAQLMTDWGFPQGMIEAVGSQHATHRNSNHMDTSTAHLTESLILATIAARILTHAQPSDHDISLFKVGLLRCGFTSDESEEAYQGIREELNLAEIVFAIPTRKAGPDNLMS